MQAVGDQRKGKPRHRNRGRGRGGRGRGKGGGGGTSGLLSSDSPDEKSAAVKTEISAYVPPLLRWVLNLSLAGAVPRSTVYQAVAHLCHLEMLLEEGKEEDNIAAMFRSTLEGSVDRSGAMDFLALCSEPMAEGATPYAHGEGGAEDGALSKEEGAGDGAAEITSTPSSDTVRVEV